MDENQKTNAFHCKNCGEELDHDAEYCPHCGTQTERKQIVYRKAGRGNWHMGQVVAILFGGFLVLIGLPILAGGTAVMGVTNVLDNGNGYIGVNGINFETSTQVLVFKEIDLVDEFHDDFDFGNPGLFNVRPDIGNLAKIKITVESEDDKPVFIGIMREDDAKELLADIEYSYVTNFQLKDPWDDPYIRYRLHPGDELTTPPRDINEWVEEASGYGRQTLTWSPEYGNYWVVMMNNDLSENVDFDTSLGVKVPLLNMIGTGMFVGGLLTFALGAVVIYFGAIKRRD